MISLTIEASVATVTLCRSPVNAINEEWIEQLDCILAEIERQYRRSDGLDQELHSTMDRST